jgi:hypothetical protein
VYAPTAIFKVDFDTDKGFFKGGSEGIELLRIRVFIIILRYLFGPSSFADVSNAYLDNVATFATNVPVSETFSVVVKESECISKYHHCGFMESLYC